MLQTDWRVVLAWEKRRTIVQVALLAGVVAFLVALALPRTYTTKAHLTFTVGDGSTRAIMTTRAQLVLSPALAAAVGTSLDPPLDVDSVLRRVSVTPVEGSSALAIQATDHDPVRAAAIASGIAREYVRAARRDLRTSAAAGRKTLEAPLAEAEARLTALAKAGSADSAEPAISTQYVAALRTYETLLEEYDRLSLDAVLEPPGVMVSMPATETSTPNPVAPKPAESGLLGFLAGAIAATAAVFAAQRLQSTVWSAGEIQERIDIPILARISESAPDESTMPLGSLSGDPATLRAYETLGGGLEMLRASAVAPVILVTAPGDEDFSVVAAEVASSLASTGQRVVLVSCGGHGRPVSTELLGPSSSLGLSDVLAGFELKSAIVQRDRSSLFVLAPGTRPATSLATLSSPRMLSLVATLSRWADIVVLDSPGPLNSPGTLSLMPTAGCVLLVIEADISTRESLADASRLVRSAPSLIAAMCITKIPRDARASRYELKPSSPQSRKHRAAAQAASRHARRRDGADNAASGRVR